MPSSPLDVPGGVLQAGRGPARDVDGGPRLAQLQRDPPPDTATRPRHQAHLGTCLARSRYLYLVLIIYLSFENSLLQFHIYSQELDVTRNK